ncbi:hypothetical protein APR41_18575 [Salegentibacter salinarum]|uniref:Uncharacterized protein n=1 Tax=Salegentibacter salinarum TaxID=447422 RepID=A0A2N0TRD2_9FLAO|nr:hypothetical protein [Salegentibacter salinarum]PKD17304.1 hypothetical protein APR41_18575 [Salegentibacter salinarum]SKC01819.1 hypothetical protein SAMN05660903_03808 [Salegentibacter salinarum]
MKKYLHFLIIFVSLPILNCCSDDDDDDSQTCPQTEIASMKINGELKQFDVNRWGINIDNDGTGHTLALGLMTGVFQPQQDTYAITIKLPYKQTGNNIIEEFIYLRVQNGTSSEIDFVAQGEIESNVLVNTNSCFSVTFSGSVMLNGNEIIIEDGIVEHIYDEPFD